jgi:TrmH family RNA methyltransferase
MTPDAPRHDGAGTLFGSDQDSVRPRHDPGPQPVSELVEAFRRARAGEQGMVVLEGFHPLKHALRFGATVTVVVTSDRERLQLLAREHAAELAAQIDERAQALSRKEFQRLGPYEPHTGVVSIARRVHYEAGAILADPRAAPAVVLEEPRHRGNFGAVIRVAAAAEAAGVLNTGEQDPWHPVVVRGAAGLQFALPVARLEGPLDAAGAGRPLVAFDPTGEPIDTTRVPPRALLAFGSERRGVSPELMARADACLRLPMREGVSSLNLATAVAAVLYGLRL